MKRKFILVFLLIMSFIFCNVSAYAEQTPIADTPAVDQSGTYNLDSYSSQMATKNAWESVFSLDTGEWVNSGANLFFEFNKIIYSVFKYGIDLFGKSGVLQDNVSTFTRYSSNMFDTLYGQFGLTILVIMAVYIFYLYFAKSPQRAMSQFVSFSLVIIFAFGWNYKGNDLVKWFNNISNEIQTTMIQSNSMDKNGSKKNSLISIQNTLFDLGVKEPYYLINYGKTTKINTPEEPRKSTEFLFTGEPTEKKLKDNIEKVNEAAKSNQFLQPSKAGWKFTVGFLSPIMTIALGIPLLGIQFLNFLVEVVALLVSGFVGLSAFLSLIPKFRQAFWKTMQILLGAFGIRVLIGIFFLVLVSIIDVIRSTIPTTGISSYMLQIGSICIAITLIWKNKDKLIYVVTGGVVTSMDKGILQKVTRPVKEKVGQGAKFAGDVAGLATVGVPLGSSSEKLLQKPADYMKNNAWDIYDDRQQRKFDNANDFISDKSIPNTNRIIKNEDRKENNIIQNEGTLNKESEISTMTNFAATDNRGTEGKLDNIADSLNSVEEKILKDVDFDTDITKQIEENDVYYEENSDGIVDGKEESNDVDRRDRFMIFSPKSIQSSQSIEENANYLLSEEFSFSQRESDDEIKLNVQEHDNSFEKNDSVPDLTVNNLVSDNYDKIHELSDKSHDIISSSYELGEKEVFNYEGNNDKRID